MGLLLCLRVVERSRTEGVRVVVSRVQVVRIWVYGVRVVVPQQGSRVTSTQSGGGCSGGGYS